MAQAPLLFSGAPAIAVTARALDRFIADPRILTLRVKGKDAPLKIGDLSHIDNLMVLFEPDGRHRLAWPVRSRRNPLPGQSS